ncbi:uncharacterized protein [Coffea arabica]|uniref:Reverse transcriptase domain-containing protein n=1 Tax=Coffea arabica TaxID=13443 RepID=A0A6P6TSH9_COFAR
MKEDAGPIMLEEEDDASVPKDSFISKPSSIFAEGQVAAMGDETDNIVIQALSQMDGSSNAHHGEQTIMSDQLDKQQANEKPGTHLPADNSLTFEHHHMAESNALDNIYVDLRGAEDDFVSTDNAVAGNLSPRLVVPPQQQLESSSDALNIDQPQRDDREFRQMRGKGVRARFTSDRQLSSDQHISLHVQNPLLPSPIIMSFVHAKCSVEERRELWCSLLNDKPTLHPWCIGGDFNVILAPHEKCGGRPFAIAEGADFMSFMEEAGVFDVGFSGSSFTWSNNRRSRARISKRLDRFLVNGACLDLSDAISVLHLTRHPSDHAPLKISFATRLDNKPRPFRFLNVWTSKPELLEVIRQAWNQNVDGSPLRILCSKLLTTRRAIQSWNKQFFGNIMDTVHVAEIAVQRAEEMVDQNDSDECQIELNKAQAELRHALSIEEQFWRQKARVKWLKEGDRNSRYFHAVVKQRRVQGMIHCIKNSNGVWMDKEEDIASEAISYFNDLFTGPLDSFSDMLHLIPRMISPEDNGKLESLPTIEEVYQVVKSMDEESAAGPDGFTGKFFIFAWEVIKQDIHNAILSFFCGAELPRFITSTSIVLIPKMSNPQEFSHFRPISLCNFFNKLLSRILADRLAGMLPRIISPQQTGFVKGRNITENFLLAQEVVSGIGKRNRGGNVAMKLDMSKAYDRVAWGHIINVLRSFGFGEIFIDMVWRLLSNVWFSIIINGSSHGFFKSMRGLRQGDPLSPALFIIGAEVLSRGLNNLALQSGFLSFKVPYGCPDITHLAFADDILIFANGSALSLRAIMQVLEAYQRCSGQLINVQKSCYLVHPMLSTARRRVIHRITKFSYKPFPIYYLGFPLYFGRCKSSYFGGVCQSIIGRIQSWKSRLLSFGGKIVLIKHVLESMPVHLMSASVIPGKVFKIIEKTCSSFLWGSFNESKFHWIRWSQLCYPVDEGGVGFQRLQDVYTAFSSKLWWNFRTRSSLWETFMKAKYCRGLHPCQVELKNKDSSIWRRMVNVSRQVEFSMLWVAKEGACHFWYDNWLGCGALFLQVPVNLELSFHNFINNGHWDVNLLYHTIPKEYVSYILQQPIPEEGSEVEVFWMPTTSGKFSIHSAFQDIRQTRNKSMVFASIWHPRIPFKVSFFMFRLLRGRIPIPDRLCELGFHLPSKCFCCPSASEESIEHLFSNGHTASVVWSYFGGLCGLSPGTSLRSRIVGWWLRSYDSELRRIMGRIIPTIICWQIWKARNKAMFEGAQMRSSAICQAIFLEIQSMVGIHFKQAIRSQSFRQLYDLPNFTVGRVAFKVIRWESKESGRFILNTDGCSKGNPGLGGGGGVLRDSTGLPLFGFSAYFGQTTSLHAEVRALLIGLQTCKQRGFGNICIQSDSLALVRIILRQIQCPWQITREVRQIRHFLEDATCLSHCYREANTVADALSNEGVSHPQQQVSFEDCLQALHWIKNSQDEWLTKYADLSNSFPGTSAGGNISYHVGLSAPSSADDLQPLNIKGVILHQTTNHSLVATRGRIRSSGWKILVTGYDGDPLFDRQVELVKMLEDEGVPLVAKFAQGGYHGIVGFELPKLKVLCQVVKEFMISFVTAA